MDLGFQVILLVQFFLGISVNGFILGVLFTEWITGGSLNAIDMILISVGLIRFLWHWVISLTCLFPDAGLLVSAICITLSTLLNWSSFALVSVLCVTFCIKISNYNNAIFIYVKLRISDILKRLILGSLGISLAYSVISVPWDMVVPRQNNSDILLERSAFFLMGTSTDYSFALFCFAFSVSFIMRFASISALIHSLRRHMRQIQCSGEALQNPHLAAHIRVIKVMLIFLALYIMYFTSLVMGSLERYRTKQLPNYYVIVLCLYPSVHSGVLIYSNRRLRKACVAMCLGSIHWAKARKPIAQTQNPV
ncbi:bitter taste receptor 13 [Xenopus tropicalis]|uniref:Taste receptor type 2 n=1 Tax=Xenopus tropicalis TaxID=8364 RepID=Q2AB69_XENTR|nr:bitter taste receptor 13 [Xenopus tropicalis]BAE80398.1 bitter taste receptor [Xenopus tropicalis]|eukprot:NP_001165474.1 bitter taste receptor 13 [Xenopus tropicalis]